MDFFRILEIHNEARERNTGFPWVDISMIMSCKLIECEHTNDVGNFDFLLVTELLKTINKYICCCCY